MKSRWATRGCGALLMIALGGCATSPPQDPENLCAIFTEHRDWYFASIEAQQRWKTSTPVAMAILYQESSFEHDARPARTRLLGFIPWKRPSSAYGYAQALDGTWAKYQRDTGQKWRKRTRFADAVDFVHWYMRQAINTNGVKRQDARSLYLNYHEGLGGFKRKTYTKKPWLGTTAKRVSARAQRYARQYAGCRQALKPSFWERLWSE